MRRTSHRDAFLLVLISLLFLTAAVPVQAAPSRLGLSALVAWLNSRLPGLVQVSADVPPGRVQATNDADLADLVDSPRAKPTAPTTTSAQAPTTNSGEGVPEWDPDG